MHVYETVVEALNDLKQRGYTTDFNLAFDKIKCLSTGKLLSPADFEITEVYRFEGISSPEDEEVIYVIEAKDDNMKGALVSAYGPYSEALSDEMVGKLSMHRG